MLWDIVSGAPWWVWLLIVVLVNLGIRSTKVRTVAAQRLILFPLVFVLWSAYRLYQNGASETHSLIFWWVIALAIGAYLGFKEVSSWRIHVDRKKGTITIPGNYSTLLLIITIFVLNFFWGYFYATLSVIPYGVHLADTITTTIATGFFVGRAAFFFKSYTQK